MTRQEIINKRDNFVKILKEDISNNLDFDFTRPEMSIAFLDKYYNDVSFFLKYDVDVLHNYVSTDKEDQNKNLQIKIKNIEETEYILKVTLDTKYETISKRYTFNKNPEDTVTYNEKWFICVNNKEKRYILSRFFTSDIWFLNSFDASMVSIMVDTLVFKAVVRYLNLKNLSDFVDRLENHLWLPEEENKLS